MIIGLTGATGFVGRAVRRYAHQRGHEIIAFTRTPERAVDRAIETREFRLDAPPDFRGCEAVIHLAGEPILGLWTRAKRRAIVESRVRGTRRVAEGLAAHEAKPEVLLSASAIGFYGDGGEVELTEESPRGRGFLAETTDSWEREAAQAPARVVTLRIGIVLGREAGALKLMAPIFRAGLGGVLGSGQQWMSWIHLEDLARLILFAVEDLSVRGPVNATAPWPVRHADFVRTLARVLQRPAFFRVPAYAVELALRGLAAELLESKRVLPAAAVAAGFGFRFPELEPALRDLFGSRDTSQKNRNL
jgi:uncharacterized protein (TIGR01777 family)